ncbi:MAG: retropepsin-like aspartic protease family protein [Candidatus Methylumidiphilus sp.]
MEQKNHYRDKANRHPNFRHEQDSIWSSFSVRLALLVGVLFCAVLGYDHLRKRGGEAIPDDHTSSLMATNNPPPDSPTDDPAEKTRSAINQRVKLPNFVKADTPANLSRPLQKAEIPPTSSFDKSATIYQYIMDRDSLGNIIGMGKINGVVVRFLADTGATTVVVPERLANQIGLKKGASIPYKTGGGIVVHYATTLDSLTLGQIEMRHVAAAINPSMQDEFVLLGMSALGLMDMQMDQGNLVLKYKASAPEGGETQPVADVPFKHSYRECVKGGNKFDKETLDCMRGK